MVEKATCPACGYEADETGGPTHAYMSPSAPCWAQYGEVLAREYSDAGYWASHRLLTDAYCGQHSIGEDRRARQSLHIHLAALMMHFEDQAEENHIVSFLRNAASVKDFCFLETPAANSIFGIDEIYAANSALGHGEAVRRYARQVFDAWGVHHPVFRKLIERHVT